MTLSEALKVNGKVRQIFWNSYAYIRYEPNDFCGGKFFNEKGQQITLSPDSYLADNWEPYKEPCAHEPAPYIYPEFENPKQDAFYMKCKHCGPKIRATGWEVV